jgi:hypothetical protein
MCRITTFRSTYRIYDGGPIRIHIIYIYLTGARGGVELRHYATNRQVAGQIPDSVIGIFR